MLSRAFYRNTHLQLTYIRPINYCPPIRLFCSKAANSDINRAHKLALRVLYQGFESAIEELLLRDDENVQKLLLEIYKTLHHLTPSHLWQDFQTKSTTYTLRKQVLRELLQRSRMHRFKYSSLTRFILEVLPE